MESTLAIHWQEYKARIGTFAGWGRGPDYQDKAWSDRQLFEIEGIVASGLRRFYNPPPLPGEKSVYDWGFLHPVQNLNVDQSTNSRLLPDDFAGFEGMVTVTAATTWNWCPLDMIGIGDLDMQIARYPTSTGRPLMVASEPLKGVHGLCGQRHRLKWWPISDQPYTFRVAYYILPNALQGSFPFPYGGAQHAETILASCYSVAEQRLDDQRQDFGPHYRDFMERLAASIAADRKTKPQKLGYNADRSDIMDRRYRGSIRRYWNDGVITYNSITPE